MASKGDRGIAQRLKALGAAFVLTVATLTAVPLVATIQPAAAQSCVPGTTPVPIQWGSSGTGFDWFNNAANSVSGASNTYPLTPDIDFIVSYTDLNNRNGDQDSPLDAAFGNTAKTQTDGIYGADYFTLVLGSDESLASIRVDAYTFGPANPNVSFLAYTVGDVFTGQDFGDIDGNTLFNAASGDLLGQLAGGPLGAGTYSFWVQETSATLVDYQLTFEVVPEPSTAALLGLGLMSVALSRRRV